jgi:hypothetical protein
MHAFFDNTEANRRLGLPANLQVSLVDGDSAITGASVVATVTRPDGAEEVISLHDDGAAPHDNRPNDGVYGYAYDRINLIEFYTYAFDIVATGDGFSRYKRLTFRPPDTSAPDGNGDGLFDVWQQRFGVVGELEDPDRDDLTNFEEMQLGTNPRRADSDHGGENDGSEVDHGRNPNEEGDDAIAPLWNFHIENEPGSVRLVFDPHPSFDSVRVFRRDGANPFSPVGVFNAARGVISDTGLINDEEYIYFLQPLGAGNVRGAYSPRRLAEPAADPYPPEGQVFINDGAPATDNLAVTLGFLPSFLPDGSPDITQMKVSNTPDLLGDGSPPWQPFVTELPWTIAPNPQTGAAFVYVLFLDAAGNVSEYVHTAGIVYTADAAARLTQGPRGLPSQATDMPAAGGHTLFLPVVSQR